MTGDVKVARLPATQMQVVNPQDTAPQALRCGIEGMRLVPVSSAIELLQTDAPQPSSGSSKGSASRP